jgi:PhnB protein
MNNPVLNTPVSAIPEGYHSVTPYLIVDDAAALIEFLKSTFGATELSRQTQPDGSIGHTEMKLGDSVIMLSQSPGQWKAMPCMLYIYIDDVDTVYARGLAAGGTAIQPPTDQSYGDRRGAVLDSNGNQWWIATHQAPRKH